MEKNLELGPQGKYAQLTLDFPFKKAFATEGEEDHGGRYPEPLHPRADQIQQGCRP